MGIFIKIAWRNIWRNRRRSVLIIAAIAFSVALSIFSLAIGDGVYDMAIRNTLKLHHGYIQIQEKGYQDDPSVEMVFEYSDEIKKLAESNPLITAVSPRLQNGALIGTGNSSTGGMVVGIDPAGEKKLTTLHRKIVRGKYLHRESSAECIIGERMAENLGVDLGSPLVILTQGVDGSTGAVRFTVTGIFRTGIDEMDRTLAFVNLPDGDQLLNSYGMIHALVINVSNPRQVEEVVSDLMSRIPGESLEVVDWKKLIPGLLEFSELDKAFSHIFLGLLMLVVIFGVLSAIFAAILERTREIGLMLALGTRPEQVVLIVLLESLILTATGVIIGLGIGLAVTGYVVANPINMSADYEPMMEHFGMENKLYAAIYPGKVLLACGSVIFLSLLFSLYPAIKAASLKPDKALRSME